MNAGFINIEGAIDTLFGADIFLISYDKIKNINPKRVKEQFRKRAKQFHPDRAEILGINESQLCEEFKKINEAYLSIMKAIKLDLLSGTQTHARRSAKLDNVYSGVMPKRKLRFAEYLYYSGIIPWKSIIEALAWQYRQRPRIGEIAVEMNFLDREAVIEVIKNMRFSEKFGEACLRMGLLTQFQLNIVIGNQKRLDKPIGRYFVEQNYLSQNEINKLLEENRKHNLKIYTTI
ncbi:MAG TPA: J domain-containing protein [Spirochaetota bacterium]|jgi:hypothetical protein|nr:MAG: DnaJ domain protein [Spirochaetes bacterium ADurb.Bin133]HNZ27540.1 J domain-containing protein [Spirochaetota bacterium]HPY87160.1 J domain-containing protein [Spirochaetota bacterium]HQB61330.1 J domain-containing protein [Spirochaetota bacterium]